MKALKIIGITLLVLIVLFFLIGLFLPSEVHVEREKMFAASSEVIFEEVNNLKNWEDWSPWSQMADDMEITYSGPTSGEGAQSSWTSESMGNGMQTITESRPYELIKTDLDFQEQGTATGTWQFIPNGDSTRVIWAMDADMGPGTFSKYMGLFMDSMVGTSFEQGFNNLQEHLQEMPTDTTSVKPDSLMNQADSLQQSSEL